MRFLFEREIGEVWDAYIVASKWNENITRELKKGVVTPTDNCDTDFVDEYYRVIVDEPAILDGIRTGRMLIEQYISSRNKWAVVKIDVAVRRTNKHLYDEGFDASVEPTVVKVFDTTEEAQSYVSRQSGLYSIVEVNNVLQ